MEFLSVLQKPLGQHEGLHMIAANQATAESKWNVAAHENFGQKRKVSAHESFGQKRHGSVGEEVIQKRKKIIKWM
ncbi:unnamed protein product [Cuscuta campestris]|uniref:Uncharacterized protein n=1 Tax=Cuscuta campestris TaxID=132261 RepID=A0A484N9I0_9ASTE|nr:unnamed protein product [Cuscuta campestris]